MCIFFSADGNIEAFLPSEEDENQALDTFDKPLQSDEPDTISMPSTSATDQEQQKANEIPHDVGNSQ